VRKQANITAGNGRRRSRRRRRRGGGKGNKIGQLARNTDLKPLLVLCKMRIAPDLQSDLNVRRAYTFLDI
jgi:hypothetical protein